MEQEEEQLFSVWIDRNQQIVSFESVEGYEVLFFESNEEKIHYVVALGKSGFRIQ